MESHTFSSEIDDYDFVSSLKSCLHLMPDWICRAREDYKEEDCDNHGSPLRLLQSKSRVALWNVTRGLNVRTAGVAGLACRLIERYICAQLRHHTVTPAEGMELLIFVRRLSRRIPILMAVCVQIAAKNISAALSLTAKHLCSYLNRNGVKHSVKDVIAWEHHVFQTIGYRVPLWTSLEMAEALAMQTRSGLAPHWLSGLVAVVELSEMRRDAVDARVRWAAALSPDSGTGSASSSAVEAMCVRTLHLAAGAVAAAVRCFTLERAHLVERRLADACDAPVAYVECVRDAILTVVVSPTENKAKRRRLE